MKRWLFHVVRTADLHFDDAGFYRPASLAGEGFVHVSYRDAVDASARLYFDGVPAEQLRVLVIDPRRLAAPLRVEDTPRGPMPHVVGPIPREATYDIALGAVGEQPDAVASHGHLIAPEHELHLESERLVLRRFTPRDIDVLFELDSDPEVVRHVGGPRPTSHRTYLEGEVIPRVLGYYAKYRDRGVWAAHEKRGGGFIGWFLYRPDREQPDEPELGYRLRRGSWGRGYATEMSRTLVAHAFDVLGDVVVTARALTANRASWHVMEKLGMTRRAEYIEEDTGLPAVRYALEPGAFVRR
ncbi:MAG: GNAT family N-acetyltransferase [Polyangiaceae bacterium]